MEKSLTSQTKSSFIWSAIESLSGQLVTFVVGIVLARLLSPSDFGVIGMLSIFMALSSSIIDSGFGKALIQKKDRTETDYSTVFYFNIVVAAIIYLLLFLAAPFIAEFYRMPILTIVVRVISLKFIISSFQLVQTTKLTIELDFKRQTKINLSSNIISGAVGILLAYMGFGVWALVYQQLTSIVIQTILLWVTTKWHPSFVFSKDSFKSLFGFGSKLLITGLYGPVFSNLNSLIIGRMYSPALLGFYSRANSLSDLPTAVLQSIIGRVTFPVLSKIQDDDERLSNAYRELIKHSYFLIFPVLLGICAASDSIVSILLGEKWMDCVPYLRLTCFACAFYQICAFNISLLLVKGRSGMHLRLDLIKKIVSVLVLLICASISVMAICVGAIFCNLFSWIITAYYSGKLMNLSIWKQIYDITPSFLIACIMALTVYFIGYLPYPIVVILFLQIIIGAIIYIVLSLIFTKSSIMRLIQIIKQK